MGHKYLEEIGCFNYNTLADFITDERQKTEQETGVNPVDLFDLDVTMMGLLYERLKLFVDTITYKDLTIYEYIYKDKKFKGDELIDELILLGTFLLGNPENLPPDSDNYKKLINNKYYIRYNEIKQSKDLFYSKIMKKEISGYEYCDEYEDECTQDFWNIWALIYPIMWY